MYGLFEFEHKVPITMEASRLMNIDVFIWDEWGMDEGSSDVGLGKNQVHASCQDCHRTNSGPLDSWGPSLKKVNTFDLHVTINTETGLELLSKAIRKSTSDGRPKCWEGCASKVHVELTPRCGGQILGSSVQSPWHPSIFLHEDY